MNPAKSNIFNNGQIENINTLKYYKMSVPLSQITFVLVN